MSNAFKDFFALRRKRITRLVIWPFGLLILLTSSRWGTHSIIEGSLFTVGCMLVAIATVGRLWCSLYICGYKSEKLITSGPYSLCRNPLYFFSSVGALGVGFATGTFTFPAILVLLFAASYPSVIRYEETKLAALHGQAFTSYLASVPRFWPRLTGILEPENYVVVPRKFRSAMFDALWFMWLVGLLALAAAFRSEHVIPTVLSVW
jgi:protein-S-isoprenylcysteine O-methyltransferase Ste14